MSPRLTFQYRVNLTLDYRFGVRYDSHRQVVEFIQDHVAKVEISPNSIDEVIEILTMIKEIHQDPVKALTQKGTE